MENDDMRPFMAWHLETYGVPFDNFDTQCAGRLRGWQGRAEYERQKRTPAPAMGKDEYNWVEMYGEPGKGIVRETQGQPVAPGKEMAILQAKLEAVRQHAYITDAGRICDRDKRISYKEQLKRSEEFVDRLMSEAAALQEAKP